MIDCQKIKHNIADTLLGSEVHCFDVLDSTNTHILDLARSGAPEGTLVISDFQTSGRGRMGKQWTSPAGKNLLFSLLLKPELPIEFTQKITLAAAYILARTLERFLQKQNILNIQIDLKWPNDLLIAGKKVAGILTESILQDKKIVALAIGFGININMTESDFPDGFRQSATSLLLAGNRLLNREDLLLYFLHEFEVAYHRLERTRYQQVVENWKKHCRQFNQPISIKTAAGEQKVIFHDVNEQGYLLYRDEAGAVKQLVSGEVICY